MHFLEIIITFTEIKKNEFMEKIIEKIAEIRNKKGFSYENVAQDLDLSTSAYRKIETGETKLTVERLRQLAEILETPIEDFLQIDSQKNFNQENKGKAKGVQVLGDNIFNEYYSASEKLLEKIKDLTNKIEILQKKD